MLIKMLYLAFAALQVADVATTYYIIRKKIGHEANPIMAWMMDKLGLVAGLLLPKAALATVLYVLAPGIGSWGMVVVLGLYVWVIYNNARVIRAGLERAPP